MRIRVIDVRQAREYASGHIEGSELVPLGTLANVCPSWDRSHPIELVCKSGMRATTARSQLLRLGFTDVRVLRGGIDAWRGAGKPLVVESRDGEAALLPCLGNQVLVASGVAVLFSLLLGKFVSPGFYEFTALVALLIAFDAFTAKGLTASLLARLPWNRKPSESRTA